MYQTRRDFMRLSAMMGAAGAASWFLPVGMMPRGALAQSPVYNVVDIVTLKGELDFGDGFKIPSSVRGMTTDGSIFGGVIRDGLQVPAVWTVAGQETLFDGGEHGASIQRGNQSGDFPGSVLIEPYENIFAPVAQPVVFRDGVMTSIEIPADLPLGTDQTQPTGGARDINQNGVLTGSMNGVAFRGDENGVEVFEGGLRSGGVFINSSGDVAGIDSGAYQPFIWRADGSVERLQVPVFPSGLVSPEPSIVLLEFDDDGTLTVKVTDFGAPDAYDDTQGMVVRYVTGEAEILPIIGEGMLTDVTAINTGGSAIGTQHIQIGTPQTYGVLVNGEYNEINSVLTAPSDIVIESLSDIDDNGVILATGTDSLAQRRGVLLVPA